DAPVWPEGETRRDNGVWESIHSTPWVSLCAVAARLSTYVPLTRPFGQKQRHFVKVVVWEWDPILFHPWLTLRAVAARLSTYVPLTRPFGQKQRHFVKVVVWEWDPILFHPWLTLRAVAARLSTYVPRREPPLRGRPRPCAVA